MSGRSRRSQQLEEVSMKDLLKQLGGSKARGSKQKKETTQHLENDVDDESPEIDDMDVDDAPTVPTKKRERDSSTKKDKKQKLDAEKSSSIDKKPHDAEISEPASKRRKSDVEHPIQTLTIATSLLPSAPMAAPPPRPPSVPGTPSNNRTPQRSRTIQPSSPAKRRLFDAPAPDQITELPPLMPLVSSSASSSSSSSSQQSSSSSSSYSSTSVTAGPVAVFGTPTKRLMATVSSPTASPARAIGPLSPRKASQDIKEALGKDFWLPLPPKYTEIEELFKFLEIVVTAFRGKKMCTFDAVKASIEQSTQRQFTKKHLAKIAAVYPEAFSISVHRPKQQKGFFGASKSEPQTVIESTIKFATLSEQNVALFDRRVEFHRRLLQRVRKQHSDFLSKHGRKWDEQTLWHPDFVLESCPDIEESQLPDSILMPHQSNTASSSTNRAASYKQPTSVESILLGGSNQHLAARNAALQRMQATNSTLSSEIEGVTQGTIDRVRLQNKIVSMEESPEYKARERKKFLVEHLPLLCDMIWSFFSSQDRSTVPLDSLLDALVKSHKRSFGRQDIADQLKLLTEQAPTWCRVFTSDGTTWFKLLKEVKLCVDAKLRLQDLYKQLVAEDTRVL